MLALDASGTLGSKNLSHAVVILALAWAGVSLLPPPPPHAAANRPRPNTTLVNARSARIPFPLVPSTVVTMVQTQPALRRLRGREDGRLAPGGVKRSPRAHRPTL